MQKYLVVWLHQAHYQYTIIRILPPPTHTKKLISDSGITALDKLL